MKFFLRGLILLSVVRVAVGLCIYSIPPPNKLRPYTINPFSKSAKQTQIKRQVRAKEEIENESSFGAASEFHAQEERVRRFVQKQAVYKPGEHRPVTIHPTYRVPQTTAKSYGF